MSHSSNRRTFLAGLGLAGTALSSALGGTVRRGAAGFHLAVNEYSWVTFFERDGRDFKGNLATGLAEVAAGGLQGYEPSITAPSEIASLKPLLEDCRLELRSIYVNTTLHEERLAESSLETVLGIAEAARKSGIGILVTNPSPIRWGSAEDKTDAQLMTQSRNLQKLGEKLSSLGLVLAYHNHDPEFRQGAREFHHMMVGTDPRHVRLCLDCHWVFRGAGNSQVALFDVIQLYGKRVVELHIRQSENGVWTESLGPGDLDYPQIVDRLSGLGVQPHLVLEQAPEKGTPRTMNALECHKRSVAYARSVFWKFNGDE